MVGLPVNTTWQKLQDAAGQHGAGLWLLIDPDETFAADAASLAKQAGDHGCDAILLGASTGADGHFAHVAKAVHEASAKPVLLFPNGAAQVIPHADAILFMSLLSGRNPRFLVEEQVAGAPDVHAHNLETISTAYLLVESGVETAVQQVSQTRPLDRNDIENAWSHALAAKYLGMSLLYLEAGSGAPKTVPAEMVTRCASAGLPVAVGGGIRTPEQAGLMVSAGARFVIVGNRFQPNPDLTLLDEFVSAVHPGSLVDA
jgi:phosphoglycerol geranylgeranyltransferase